jgi:hypothetical protein
VKDIDGNPIDIEAIVAATMRRAMDRAAADPDQQKQWLAEEESNRKRTFVERAARRGIPCDDKALVAKLYHHEEALMTTALNSAQRAIEEHIVLPSGMTVVLAGPIGTGKTFALCFVVAHYRGGALYALEREMIAYPRTGYSENEDRWRRWSDVPVLAIDELGRGLDEIRLEARQLRIAAMRDLLRLRHDRGKLTLCAGNIDCDAVRVYLDDSLADRVAHQNGNVPWFVGCSGVSLRRSSLAEESVR